MRIARQIVRPNKCTAGMAFENAGDLGWGGGKLFNFIPVIMNKKTIKFFILPNLVELELIVFHIIASSKNP